MHLETEIERVLVINKSAKCTLLSPEEIGKCAIALCYSILQALFLHDHQNWNSVIR